MIFADITEFIRKYGQTQVRIEHACVGFELVFLCPAHDGVVVVPSVA